MHFLHIANSDKPVKAYSLDVIISVGYRVKSQRGTQFRIWANRILKVIIDEKDIYHLGASLKDLGKKWFAFSKIHLEIKEVISRL